jgi:hypothetical protein
MAGALVTVCVALLRLAWISPRLNQRREQAVVVAIVTLAAAALVAIVFVVPE